MAAPDQCSLSSIDGSLSIDRLTLLFYCPKLSLWNSGCDNSMYVRKMSNLVENVLRSDLDPDFPQGSRTELFDQHYRTLSGFDIQFGTRMPKRKKIKDENYLIAFGSPYVEGNPVTSQTKVNIALDVVPNKIYLLSELQRYSLLDREEKTLLFSRNKGKSVIQVWGRVYRCGIPNPDLKPVLLNDRSSE